MAVMIAAEKALQRLQEGNRRFVAESHGQCGVTDHHHRLALVEGQNPFAIILGCSDSRVPAEIVFDQGLGDLFVIRVAGHVVAPSQIGSVEYAAAVCGARLAVVMGHSRCGAIEATLQHLDNPPAEVSPDFQVIVNGIRPAVDRLGPDQKELVWDERVRRAIRANVALCVEHLRSESKVLRRLIAEEGLRVVGAEYSLETGEVEFFDS